MRVAVTGTPGTGKTSSTRRLSVDFEVIHLNEVVDQEELTAGFDYRRGSWIADIDAITAYLRDRDDIVVESHFAHRLPMDRVVVLRCQPSVLEARLLERGVSPAKARENAESEALDVILTEAIEEHGVDRVFEIDTTEMTPKEAAGEVERVISGELSPRAGTVSFLDYLDEQ